MINHATWLLVGVLLCHCRLRASVQFRTNRCPHVSDEEYAKQRRQLVAQLRSEGIQNQGVLDALLKFHVQVCSPSYRHLAYRIIRAHRQGSDDLSTFHSWLHD